MVSGWNYGRIGARFGILWNVTNAKYIRRGCFIDTRGIIRRAVEKAVITKSAGFFSR
jgi:hypothetical protein